MKNFLVIPLNLLFVLGSCLILHAQPYYKPDSYDLPEVHVFSDPPKEKLNLLANQPQQYRIDFQAGRQITLNFHLKSNFNRVLKKSTPFFVVGATQLYQGRSTTPSVDLPPSTATNQIRVGVTAGIGALTGISTRHSARTLATISLYSVSGSLRKTESRWLRNKNETLCIISKKRDGYAIVTLQSTANSQITIEPSTQPLAEARIGGAGLGNNPGNQPITNDDPCYDPDGNCDPDIPDDGGYGIEGGSGTGSDPYVLTEVTVIADGSGETTDYGGGYYYYTGGYWNGYYYDSGYYQDGNYSNNPPGGLDHAYSIEPLNCEAYSVLNSFASTYGKEYGAVITSTGQLIFLPAAGNQLDHTDFGGVYQDDQGRTIVSIYPENGNWYIQTNDYSNGVGQPTVFQITGMIHTHPSGTAPNGLPWDTYNPSPDDLNLLNSYSGLNQYISAPDKTFQYNSSGSIPNSSAPNSCQ